jgi:LSD1 subclass zinc finger protein
MPFIIQCPYADCAKFMLLEDTDRGATVACLVCKRSIKLDPSQAGDKPAPSASSSQLGPKPSPQPASPQPAAQQPAGAAAAVAQRQNVRTCPKCSTPLKVPAGAPGQRIRCPKCSTVF